MGCPGRQIHIQGEGEGGGGGGGGRDKLAFWSHTGKGWEILNNDIVGIFLYPGRV